MNREHLMEPGDRFVADECGCEFVVAHGPNSEEMANQAPRCCCGHEMHKDHLSAPPPPD